VIFLLTAGGMALLVSGLGTPVLARVLGRRGIGQQIREDGPQRHVTKAGTPTMGGIAIVVAAVCGYLMGHFERGGSSFTRDGLLAVAVLIGGCGVGLLDDWLKVHRQRSLGLNKRAKLIGQVVVGAGFALAALYWVGQTTNLSYTRWSSTGVVLHYSGWAAFAALVLIGSANAVNFTDGLDGLAAGSGTLAFSCLAVIGYWQYRHYSIYRVGPALDLAVMAVAMAGACAGFLWWNAAPAQIFMGDTGALAIGATLAAVALQMNLDLLLPIIAGLFVIETLSVVAQIVSFRLFHRRVFRMAPLHHHFELLGWPEPTVIVRLWIMAGLCTALALGLFYADFISVGIRR
jgi:phospho-N-acetylmuramoyl-pentapeptide-transferase